MNVSADILAREPIKLTTASFLQLRGFGAFDDYWKVELLDGELWGVPAEGDEEPQSDAVHPIRLTIEQYELLAKSGAFIQHRKTELINGRVYPVSPQYRPHGFVKDRLAFRLDRALEISGSTLMVATEQSMAIPHFSEPQPDIMLTSEASGEGAVPVASVALIVEVSDSTSRYDLRHKSRIYSLAGIPEYWVVDVLTRTTHQVWRLEDNAYVERREVAFGEVLIAQTIARLSISTGTVTARTGLRLSAFHCSHAS